MWSEVWDHSEQCRCDVHVVIFVGERLVQSLAKWSTRPVGLQVASQQTSSSSSTTTTTTTAATTKDNNNNNNNNKRQPPQQKQQQPPQQQQQRDGLLQYQPNTSSTHNSGIRAKYHTHVVVYIDKDKDKKGTVCPNQMRESSSWLRSHPYSCWHCR